MNSIKALCQISLLCSFVAWSSFVRALDCTAPLKAGSDKVTAQGLRPLLEDSSVNGREIIGYLSQDEALNELFIADAGVSERYSIQQHTQMVFDVLADQLGRYKVQWGLHVPQGIRLVPTLKFAIALHDIGKPCAVQAGDKRRQHEFTLPILERALRYFELTPDETRLAEALVDNDVLGSYIRGFITLETAADQLLKLSSRAGLPPAEFVPLQFLFYTADAGSYPYLRSRVFTTDDKGLMLPRGPYFQRLWDIVSHAQ